MLKVLLREARKIIIHSGSYKRSTKWIYAEALQRFVISEKFDTFDTIPNNHHRYPHILRSGWNTYKLKVSFLAVAVVLPDLSFNPLLNWISVKSGSIFDPTNHSDQIRKCGGLGGGESVVGWPRGTWQRSSIVRRQIHPVDKKHVILILGCMWRQLFH